MGALFDLGLRLTRAGRSLRFGSVVLGCALSVALVTMAWVLPDAMFPPSPDPLETDPRRAPIASLLALITAPVIALLLAVGRMSAEVRDRRLASLMLLGVSRARTLTVAAVENLLPATVGAVAGIGLFGLLRVLTTALARDALAEPIVGGSRTILVAFGVVVVSTVLALAPIRRLAGGPATASEATVTAPSAWRLVPIPLALGLLGAVFATPTDQVTARTDLALFGAAVASALSIALATPWVISGVAGLLVRAPSVSVLMAARSVQTQGPAIARRVTGLGITSFVVLSAAGYLGIHESDPVTSGYVHQAEQGPQEVWIDAPNGESPLDPGLAAQIEAVAGVQGVWHTGTLRSPCSDGEESCSRVFVGTCRDLALLADVSGCSDAQAAWIRPTNVPRHLAAATSPERGTQAALENTRTGEPITLQVPGTMEQDVLASTQRWPRPEQYDLFVPAALAEELKAIDETHLTVVADQGSRVRFDIIGLAERADASVFVPALPAYEQIATLRVVVWSVAAASIAVAALIFALASIDRARHQRRTRARLVAVGVPARLLRSAQALATGTTLAVSLAVALGLGWASVTALAHTAGESQRMVNWTLLAVATAAISASAGALTLLTLPLTRTAVRAEDLRQE
ncbi:FtsX-like permease family protein [Serinibacter salmoneus]|uniref:ABC3 transporter permease C-terminal domain-containing protein n=1 Tax=Serinibacter salmoneus TaxID=556530 RepID=A0A2A9D2M2_9MICO|nr:FtsX-like permease family protein [Serinibacter salmoneus]PFG20903.1 hypothetical protein ATL40_2519 [Serinibacter salmoneus]